eukprot:COSAG01_NODE_3530_length_5964_cov_653.329241_3_plen_165_part_00
MLLLAPAGRASPPLSPPLAVPVRADGSYSVLVGGKPWLQSGELRLFVNGEWHSTSGGGDSPTPPPPAPPPQHCLPLLNNTDAADGGKHLILKVQNSSTAECCASCLAHPQCNAFSYASADDPEGGHALAHDCFLLRGVTATRPTTSVHPRLFGFARPPAPAPPK